jgi:hypothetical protein
MKGNGKLDNLSSISPTTPFASWVATFPWLQKVSNL